MSAVNHDTLISFPTLCMTLNKFTLGAIAGITAVGIAIPALAQISNAATASVPVSSSASAALKTRPVPTQAEIQAMIARDQAFLKNIDASVAVQKGAKQAHAAALTAAASITATMSSTARRCVYASTDSGTSDGG